MNAHFRHVLLMAGGTGGHVFPALALARELRARGCRVSWLGTKQGIEAGVVPREGFDLHTLPISGLRGKRWSSLLLVPWKLGASLWSALGLILRLRPDVVVGFGGFAAGPGGLMAAALGRSLLLHEQNAVAGLTNRWLARVADRVFAGFPDAFPGRNDVEVIGNPVRREIAGLPEPGLRWRERTGPLRILVLGGSLGAQALNQVVPAALALLPADLRPHVRHQAGERTLAVAHDVYRRAGLEVEIVPFIEDMAAAYAWADLVICRAGALTVSEIAAAGLPALFVPYPHAADDHQTANAGFLVRAGSAWSIPNSELTPERLAEHLRSLTRDSLLERAFRARAVARNDATERLADACMSEAQLTEGAR